MGFVGRRKSAGEIASEIAAGVVTQGPDPLLALVDATLGGQSVIAQPLDQVGVPWSLPQGDPAFPTEAFSEVVITAEDSFVQLLDGQQTILLRAPGLYAVDWQSSLTLDSAQPKDLLVQFWTSVQGLLDAFAWFGRTSGADAKHPHVFGVIEAREDTFVRTELRNLSTATTAHVHSASIRSIRVG